MSHGFVPRMHDFEAEYHSEEMHLARRKSAKLKRSKIDISTSRTSIGCFESSLESVFSLESIVSSFSVVIIAISEC